MNKILKTALFGAAGAIVGFAYYYYIGCNTGSCAITSDPYISTAYGSVVGLLFGWPAKKKEE